MRSLISLSVLAITLFGCEDKEESEKPTYQSTPAAWTVVNCKAENFIPELSSKIDLLWEFEVSEYKAYRNVQCSILSNANGQAIVSESALEGTVECSIYSLVLDGDSGGYIEFKEGPSDSAIATFHNSGSPYDGKTVTLTCEQVNQYTQ